jgi:hypothetical protein
VVHTLSPLHILYPKGGMQANPSLSRLTMDSSDGSKGMASRGIIL